MKRTSSGKLYHVLEIQKDASQADVKKAYHKKALQLHPDKTGGVTTEEFKQVQEANAILSDPEKRKLYDLFGRSATLQLEQYSMGGAASSILANRALIAAAVGFVWLFFIALLVFVILVCVKVDYHKTNWNWTAVFTPIYFVNIVYMLPVAASFTYSGIKTRNIQVVSLGLFLFLQGITCAFFAQSLDVESNRLDHLNPSHDENPTTGSSHKNASKHRKEASNDGHDYNADAFASWQLTFYYQWAAAILFSIFVLSTLTLDQVKSRLQTPELRRISSAYLSEMLSGVFYVACILAFIFLLERRLTGIDPTLNFYLIFLPIYLNIGLVPFLTAIKNLLCSPSETPICARICSFIFVIFLTYGSLFTTLTSAALLQRTYNGADGGPSALLCSAVILIFLVAANMMAGTIFLAVACTSNETFTAAAFEAATEQRYENDEENEMWRHEHPPTGTATDAASSADVRDKLMKGGGHNHGGTKKGYGSI